MSKVKEYALYHDDSLIMIGTIDEIASFKKVNRESIKFYRTPTWLKRTNYHSYVLVDVGYKGVYDD